MALFGWIVKAITANLRCRFGHDPVDVGDGHICRRCYRRV